jgi:hypothetical protein
MNRRSFLAGVAALFTAKFTTKVAAPALPLAGAAITVVAYPKGLQDELAAITRKAFVPRLYAQLYRDNEILLLPNRIYTAGIAPQELPADLLEEAPGRHRGGERTLPAHPWIKA